MARWFVADRKTVTPAFQSQLRSQVVLSALCCDELIPTPDCSFICHSRLTSLQGFDRMKNESLNYQSIVESAIVQDILTQINDGKLLVVNSRRRNGLIIYKRFHAEFAGPGAAVGSFFDLNCEGILPVGDLSLVHPKDHAERQKAYLIRRQWIRLTQQFTDNPMPLQRAQLILNQFENYFGSDTIAQLPDNAFALLVGVLPHTIQKVRQSLSSLEMIPKN